MIAVPVTNTRTTEATIRSELARVAPDLSLDYHVVDELKVDNAAPELGDTEKFGLWVGLPRPNGEAGIAAATVLLVPGGKRVLVEVLRGTEGERYLCDRLEAAMRSVARTYKRLKEAPCE